MEVESVVTRSIIDELYSSGILGDQMEGESSVTLSVTDEHDSSDVQADQMEGDSSVTPKIIDELHSGISKEIKWKVKVLLLQISLKNFILGISKVVPKEG